MMSHEVNKVDGMQQMTIYTKVYSWYVFGPTRRFTEIWEITTNINSVMHQHTCVTKQVQSSPSIMLPLIRGIGYNAVAPWLPNFYITAVDPPRTIL